MESEEEIRLKEFGELEHRFYRTIICAALKCQLSWQFSWLLLLA